MRVVSNVLLGGFGSTSGVVASQLTNLLGLLVCDIGSLGDIVVDNLLVGLVDEWCNEGDDGGKESQTPEWNKLDQEVGDEGSEESLEMSARGLQRRYAGLTAAETATFSTKRIR